MWLAIRLIQISRLALNPLLKGTYLGNIGRVLHVMLCVILFTQLRTDHQRDDIYIYIIWIMFGLVAACANIARGRLDELEGKPASAG